MAADKYMNIVLQEPQLCAHSSPKIFSYYFSIVCLHQQVLLLEM